MVPDVTSVTHTHTHTHTLWHTHTHQVTKLKSYGVFPPPTSLPPPRTRASTHARTHGVSHTHKTHKRDGHTRIHTQIHSSNIVEGLLQIKNSHSHPPTHSLFLLLDSVFVLLDAWAGFTRTLFPSQIYVQIVMAVCLIASDSLPKNLGLVWKESLFWGGIFCKRDLPI